MLVYLLLQKMQNYRMFTITIITVINKISKTYFFRINYKMSSFFVSITKTTGIHNYERRN